MVVLVTNFVVVLVLSISLLVGVRSISLLVGVLSISLLVEVLSISPLVVVAEAFSFFEALTAPVLVGTGAEIVVVEERGYQRPISPP